MTYDITTIKNDLKILSAEQFYTKYIVCTENWYLENILELPQNEHQYILEQYRVLISKQLNISINSITMVGSGKIGYSLSPNKIFAPFNNNEETRKVSDLDIAIVSPILFNKFWRLLKNCYKNEYKNLYETHIFREIYRGYINEQNLQKIEGCRLQWNDLTDQIKKRLIDTLYIRHEITFRLYNSWEDFQDYNIQNIKTIQRSIKNEI